jgi:hypothetical protein
MSLKEMDSDEDIQLPPATAVFEALTLGSVDSLETIDHAGLEPRGWEEIWRT